jgi:hypothetical protein
LVLLVALWCCFGRRRNSLLVVLRRWRVLASFMLTSGRRGVVQSGESFHRLTMGMMAVLLGVGLLAGGIMARHFVLVAGGYRGENPILRDVRRRRLGVVTFPKASCLEPVACDGGGAGRWCC